VHLCIPIPDEAHLGQNRSHVVPSVLTCRAAEDYGTVVKVHLAS